MKKRTRKIGNHLLAFTVGMWILSGVHIGYAQQIKWLRVAELQSPINELGAEYEGEFTQGNSDFFSWPAQYGIDQNTMRMKSLWIGCHDFFDPVENKTKSVKVVGAGPKSVADADQIFPQEIKLFGKYPHPIVVVDDQRGSINDTYDVLDDFDANLEADRVVLVKFNTSIGISVTKRVMSFANPEHGNYFINDYVFKNTGIIDRAGNVKSQTLKDVRFLLFYRFAFAGESSAGWGSTWGAFSSTWGNSTINHDFGNYGSWSEYANAASPLYQLRGFYSWYGPNKDRTVPFAADWGCPNEAEDGRMGSWKYGGYVTLHADTGPGNPTDDVNQPSTTWFISGDIGINSNTRPSQYDEVFMADRYTAMSEGHPDKPHDQYLTHDPATGDVTDYPINYTDPRRQTGGGTCMDQAYGPYTLLAGDSIHIVFAEGVSGLSREKNLEVGAAWLQWYKQTGTPTLTMPDGSITTDFNMYKRRWVETGKDSILKTLRAALQNYKSGYALPQPPPPPSKFTVTSGGDRIQLSWADNAKGSPHFDGYVIYRSRGNVLDPKTTYEKIFECSASNVVHNFDDVTAVRGFDYYYYVQSKDDGAQTGKTLFSSLFWTVTSAPATLQRPAVSTTLDSVRVVPNPYDLRSRMFQFGDQSQYDRIAFYGLPPICKLKIFTERGDLIWEKDHTRGTGDELWDSLTSSGQIVASGIYILYVEAPGRGSVFRKFVIIR